MRLTFLIILALNCFASTHQRKKLIQSKSCIGHTRQSTVETLTHWASLNTSYHRSQIENISRQSLEAHFLITQILTNRIVLQDEESFRQKIILICDENNIIQSILRFKWDERHNQSMIIDLIVTAPWNLSKNSIDKKSVSGAGSIAITRAIKRALREPHCLRLHGLPLMDSLPFYRGISSLERSQFSTVLDLLEQSFENTKKRNSGLRSRL